MLDPCDTLSTRGAHQVDEKHLRLGSGNLALHGSVALLLCHPGEKPRDLAVPRPFLGMFFDGAQPKGPAFSANLDHSAF